MASKTITVCKGCGVRIHGKDTNTGKPACPICLGLNEDSGIPVEVELPETLKCYYCKRETPIEKLLDKWGKDIPFAEPKRGLYYCGCRGWD